MRARLPIAIMVLLLSCTSSPPVTAPDRSPTGTDVPTLTGSPTPPSPTRSPRGAVFRFREFDVPDGSRPHDVAPAPDGRVWYTAQNAEALGVLDPRTGRTRHVRLGSGARPHGVIVGPDDAPWVTDQGLNAIVRVDPRTYRVRTFRVPRANADPHTPTFDREGLLWFTGASGYYGSLDIDSGRFRMFDAPRGSGPYGIDAAPDGTVWYSSLSKSYLARVDPETGRARVFDLPTSGGGARRVWSDSRGVLWVTEWYAGKLARFDPRARRWTEWEMPASRSQPYAIYVDEEDIVWITDFGSNSLVRFDPETERFRSFRYPSAGADVRQLLGRPGEVWGAESGTDKLVLFTT